MNKKLSKLSKNLSQTKCVRQYMKNIFEYGKLLLDAYEKFHA